jgi:hypothetical protein
VAPLGQDAWLLIGCVAGICLLSFLYALATLYRDQTTVHDLKVRVHELRRDYTERIARQNAELEQVEAESVRLVPPAHTSPLPAASKAAA